VPPATFREMWTTPRGREAARHFAYRDFSYADYVNLPFLLTAAGFLHQSLMPGLISREHEELLWKLSCDLHAAYQNRIVTEPHLLSLGVLWTGKDRFGLAWSAIDNAVLKKQPHLRGPVALVLGHKSLKQNRRDDAVRYFTIARDTMAADAPWRPLAKAQLDRLQSK
jgi:hypothetical protein